MNDKLHTPNTTGASRREFLKTSGVAAAAGALAASLNVARQAHAAANDDTIKIALIGCGGRGTSAAGQALSTAGSVKLVAVADAFRDRLDQSLNNLTKEAGALKIDVPEDQKFVGFDAYQKALATDCDLVILATPPGFRPIHFDAAVSAGKHVFMEKPVATDAPGVRKVLEAAAEAKKKNLAVGVGLQRRHQAGYLETIQRLHDGAIGDIVATRVYWNGDRPWKHKRAELERQYKKQLSEMEYQMRNWYYFVWLCGDHITEQHIHNLDVANWVKDGHPVKANGMGGSQKPRDTDDGEIFDHHCVEFEYADGSRTFSQCRHIPGCWGSVSEHVQGTKGTSTVSNFDIRPTTSDAWRYRGPQPNPYQVEHDDLFAAIRAGKPYNEAERGALSTMTSILGRIATYSGREITWDNALKSNVSLMPTEFSWDAKPLVLPGPNGMYPQAIPGLSKVV